jgi:hypothetical protein
MSRTQKLYQRLDELDSQYSAMLRKELEAVLCGGVCEYLGEKIRPGWWPSRADDRALELQKLEKQIRGLRLKLGEPVPGAAVAVAENLVQRIKGTGEWSPVTNKAWLSEAIAKLAQLGQRETNANAEP